MIWSSDLVKRHERAVRGCKDGGGGTAAAAHHCGCGRFSRFIERVEAGELRRAGAAPAVDQRKVRSREVLLILVPFPRLLLRPQRLTVSRETNSGQKRCSLLRHHSTRPGKRLI